MRTKEKQRPTLDEECLGSGFGLLLVLSLAHLLPYLAERVSVPRSARPFEVVVQNRPDSGGGKS
jgi:hypothetical protein